MINPSKTESKSNWRVFGFMNNANKTGKKEQYLCSSQTAIVYKPFIVLTDSHALATVNGGTAVWEGTVSQRSVQHATHPSTTRSIILLDAIGAGDKLLLTLSTHSHTRFAHRLLHNLLWMGRRRNELGYGLDRQPPSACTLALGGFSTACEQAFRMARTGR